MITGTVSCPTPGAITAIPVDPAAAPEVALVRVLQPLPSDRRGRGKIHSEIQVSVLLPNKDSLRLFELVVTPVHVHIDRFDLTQVLVRLHLLISPLQFQIQMSQAGFGDHQIGAPSCCFCDVILREAMNEVDIGADHFTDAAYLLQNVVAVMQNELQVQAGDSLTSLARASGRAFDIGLSVSESRIGGFDQLQNCLSPPEDRFWRVGEDRVTLQLMDGQ